MTNSYLPGTINSFSVLRETPIGYLLVGENKLEYFLHKNECNKKVLRPNEKVTAYIYFDNKRRLACTLTLPNIQKDEIKYLRVCDICDNLGVFLDNNISKQLLLSQDYLPHNKAFWPEAGCLLPVKLKSSQTALKAVIEKEDFIKYSGQIKDKVVATITLYEKDDLILITDNLEKIKVLRQGYLVKRKVGTKVEVEITYLGFSDTLGIIKDDKTTYFAETKKQILSFLFRSPKLRSLSYFTPEVTNKLFGLSHKEFKRLLTNLKNEGLISINTNIISLKEETK